MIRLFLYFIFFGMTLSAQVTLAIPRIRLQSTTLEEAVVEYLSKSEEGRFVTEYLDDNYREIDKEAENFYFKKPPIYIYGGAALQIVTAVQKYLMDKKEGLKKGRSPLGLPFSFSRHLISPFSDVDIAIDLPDSIQTDLVTKLNQKYRERVDGKVRFEAIPLNEKKGRGLFGNINMSQQNTDALSSGMVRLLYTNGYSHQDFPAILDVRGTPVDKGKLFLEAFLEGKNYYQDHPDHESTYLAAQNKNPKIVSAIKYVVNLARYGFESDPASDAKVVQIIDEFIKTFNEKELNELDTQSRYYVLQRMDKILVKALIDSVSTPVALEVYEKFHIDKLAKLIKRFYPEYKYETTYWMQVLKRAKVQSLRVPALEQGRKLQPLDKLQHLMIIDGSQSFGNGHPKVWIDELASMARYFGQQAERIKVTYPDNMEAQLQEALEILRAFKGDPLPAGIDVIKQLAYQDIKGCGKDCRDVALRTKYFLQKLGYETFINYGNSHTETFVRIPDKDQFVSFSVFHGRMEALDSGSKIDALKPAYKPFYWKVPLKVESQSHKNSSRSLDFAEEIPFLLALSNSLDRRYYEGQLLIVKDMVKDKLSKKGQSFIPLASVFGLLNSFKVKDSPLFALKDTKGVFGEILDYLESSLNPRGSDRLEFYKLLVSEYINVVGGDYVEKFLQANTFSGSDWFEKIKILIEAEQSSVANGLFDKFNDIELFRDSFNDEVFNFWLERTENALSSHSSEKLQGQLLVKALSLGNNDPLRRQALRILFILDEKYRSIQNYKRRVNEFLVDHANLLINTPIFDDILMREISVSKNMFGENSLIERMLASFGDFSDLSQAQAIDLYEKLQKFQIIDGVVEHISHVLNIHPLLRLVLLVPDVDLWGKLVLAYENGTPAFRDVLLKEINSFQGDHNFFFEAELNVIDDRQRVVSCRNLFR